ncbi:MAG: hypothetical protein AUK47_12490 [Deltaproteobacteria bacterium CG2_30_63_29]|nr:MAG: hypothetical protein AUK47_12490 [Deltaproteobacteria bacterium CG2_30_63_29]PIW02690.1 MAG: hypothetical protein COW42_00280 [Deltaproteobacteria bacterium CG17_big_fil_post_rev_8_21_14_2_50_63_7]PJB39035.1 MAG: hypothetical protein CO108_17980 [Deltaproteobacteria bacterium CG_4_9_14_3_um_filter_63_12]
MTLRRRLKLSTKTLWALLIPALFLGCEGPRERSDTTVVASAPQRSAPEVPPEPGQLRKSKRKKKKKKAEPVVVAPVYDATKLLAPFLTSSSLAQGGITEDLPNRAMGLIRGVTAIARQTSEPQAVLAALKTYVESKGKETAEVGQRLAGLKNSLEKPRRERYRALAAARFARDVEDYQAALAGFELNASEAQINELNALLRTLAGPMQAN